MTNFVIKAVFIILLVIDRTFSEEVYVNNGSTAVLKCLLENKTINVVQWFKKFPSGNKLYAEGLQIDPSLPKDALEVTLDTTNTTYTLKITNVQQNNDGEYRCTVLYEMGPKDFKFNIILTESPTSEPIITKEPTGPVAEGQTIKLKCYVTGGKPLATIGWQCEGVGNSTNLSESDAAVFTVDLNVSKSDNSKLCMCIAAHPLWTVNKTANITLDVNYGPNLVNVYPPSQSYTVNETDIIGPISCTADCKPNCTMTWKRMNVSVGNTSVLNLQNINRNEAGNYTCTASNIVGSNISGKVSVAVNYGPEGTEIDPPDQSYTVNETGNVGPIKCTADCKPDCTITWSGPGLPSGIKSALNLQNISRSQAGSYMCTAGNIISDTKSSTVDIVVNYRPEQVHVNPLQQFYIVNETDNIGPITCNADCNPNCAMAWRRLNTLVGTKSELYIQNISRNQSGNYSCTATNKVGSIISAPVSVEVNYGPERTKINPPDHLYTVNETGNVGPIICRADCKPPCTITWSGPGLPRGTKSELNLQNVNRTQAGSYKCTAGNFISEIKSLTIVIVVNYGPKQVNVNPSSQSYMVNETDNIGPINCTADCKPNCILKWERLNDTLGNSSVLNLQNISRKLSGNYKCIAYNEVGKSTSDIISIKVNYIPEVNDLSGSTNVSEHDTVYLRCSYKSVPDPDIYWKFNDVTLKKEDVYIDTNSTMLYSILILEHIKCLSMGNYTCQATNIVGESSRVFPVDVFCSPRFYAQDDISKTTSIPITDGESLNITVHILAFPQPAIQWKFAKNDSNDSAVNISSEFISNQFSGNIHISKLFISNVSETDFGYYIVYAYNGIGSANMYIQSYEVISAICQGKDVLDERLPRWI